VPDASGGRTLESHNLAVDRMVQAGAIPLDWLTYLCELQRDHARRETAGRMYRISREHSGAYAIGLNYHLALMGHTKE